MVLVQISPTWVRGQIRTPYGSTYRRAKQGVGNYPVAIAQWLIDQGYATEYEGSGNSPAPSPSPVPAPTLLATNLGEELLGEESESDDPPVERETAILQFLQGQTAEQISSGVKSITLTKAQELIDPFPVTWEELESRLTKTQVKGLISWAESAMTP